MAQAKKDQNDQVSKDEKTCQPKAPPKKRVSTSVATKPVLSSEVTEAIKETSKAVSTLVEMQQQDRKERLEKAESDARNEGRPLLVREVAQKSTLWEIASCLVLVVIFIAMCWLIKIGLKEVQNIPQLNQSDAAVAKEFNTISDKLAAVKDKIGDLNQTIKEIALPTPPPNPAQKEVEDDSDTIFYNVLLIDNSGRVHRNLQGIKESDITEEKGRKSFLYNGKPIYWTQKVVFSYPYTESSSYTGVIYYTPEIAMGASSVINIPPGNVYQDNETIIYDDGNGCYICAPQGASYRTDQSTLPTQQ